MKKFLIRAIRFYQKNLSPKKPPCCKYYPSCSSYAIEAIEKRGAFVGFFLSLFRILRCNPFSKGGYDPVPEKGQKRRGNDRSVPAPDLPDAAASYEARHPSAVLPSSAERQDGRVPDPVGPDADEENRI